MPSLTPSARRDFNHGEGTIDLRLYSRVLRRHRALVVIGVALTFALAFLSYVRVSPSGIAYRSPAVWSNSSTMVLTQAGSPELRSVLPAGSSGVPTLGTTERFIGLVDLYAALATSDAVIQLLKQRGLLDDKDIEAGDLPVSASSVSSAVNGQVIPLIRITGEGDSPKEATARTLAATQAFLEVLTTRQTAAKIPPNNRIQVSVIKRSGKPVLAEPRSMALLLVILLGGLIATIAVAFMRDNLAGGRLTVDDQQKLAELAELRNPAAGGQSQAARVAGGGAQLRSTPGPERESDAPEPRRDVAHGGQDERASAARWTIRHGPSS